MCRSIDTTRSNLQQTQRKRNDYSQNECRGDVMGQNGIGTKYANYFWVRERASQLENLLNLSNNIF